MEGLHPDLIKVLDRFIEITPIDATVLEGLRTIERQKQLVEEGSSRTMNSRHLTGHAVDVAPYVDGTVSWSWPLYYQLADIMKHAARDVGVPLRWGGCWDKRMSEYSNSRDAVTDYVERRRANGMQAFIDGPHFELPRTDYPD